MLGFIFLSKRYFGPSIVIDWSGLEENGLNPKTVINLVHQYSEPHYGIIIGHFGLIHTWATIDPVHGDYRYRIRGIGLLIIIREL